MKKTVLLIVPLLFLFLSCEDKKEKDCAGVEGGNNICGCTDSTATNYDNTATFDDGSCYSESDDFDQLGLLKQEIINIIGVPICNDYNNCRFIGLGAKPCGGHWEYLVYSIATVDSILLINKVNEHNELNDTFNVRYGWVSDCMIVESPNNISCDNGICGGQ